MGKKWDTVFTAVLLSAVILVFTGADFVVGDRRFSENENRLLAQKPEFSVESLLQGSYTEKYEAYVTDQFVGRDKWIALKTVMDVCLQKREIGGVYLGADGYLLEQHLPEQYPAKLQEEKIALLEKLAQDWNAAVMLVPTADNILTVKLPPDAPYFRQDVFLEQVRERVGSERFIDAAAVLTQHQGEDIYYRTDHHWTSLGAYYGYLAWAQHMGVEPWPYDAGAMKLASSDFLGTLHSKINLDREPDSIYYFEETVQRPLKVTYDLKETRESLYEEAYLDTKNKYGFFLDDNHSFVEIETGAGTGRNLFVIKDSYANSLIPLLTAHYDTIYVLDLRYYNGRLYRLLEKYAADADVLVWYNCIHFLEDFQYL